MEALKSCFSQTLTMLSLLIFATTGYAAGPEEPVEYRSTDVVSPLEIDIVSFKVIGENPLNAKTTESILDPFTGSKKSIGDIEEAVKQLEKRLRGDGYSFYRVVVTSQELVGGEIELTIERYRIGEIIVTGNRFYSKKNILASLPQLKTDSSPNTIAMSRSLRIANQNSGKRTQLQLQSSISPNTLDAVVQVVDQKPLLLSTWINNTGTELSGEFRTGVGVEHRNVFNRDHIANVSFITSPENVDSVKQSALTYQIPFYKLGGKLNFFAVKSDIDTGTVAEVFEVAGRGDVLGMGYTHVLPTHNNYRHQISAQLSDKLFENDILFAGQEIGPDVRSRPISISYQSTWQKENLGLGWSVAYSKNLNSGSFNDVESYEASRQGANSRWDTYSAGMSLQYHHKKWLFSGNLNLSGSSDRLITGEQFSLGGASSVRGMEERELRGDEGYRLALKAWAPPFKWNLRPVFFMDFGEVKINQPSVDELSSESVTSLGLSLYWNPTPKLNASVSFAHLFDGVDADQVAGESLSQDGENKIHFNLVYRY